MHAYGSFGHDSDEEEAPLFPPQPFQGALPPTPQRASLLRRLATVGGVAVLVATVALAGVLAPSSARFGSGAGPAEQELAASPQNVASDVPIVSAMDTPEGQLSFGACNEYTCEKPLDFLFYQNWLKGMKLVEPHRDTFLTVGNPREGHEYYWTITDRYGAVSTKAGSEVTYQFTELEKHSVTVQEVRPAEFSELGRASITRMHTETVMCKYVRREIRSLSESEREELLDAMHTLWVVPSLEGRQLFGPDYTDITGLIKFHHKGASNISCDAFHDGLGFPISHFLMTNLFEQTIQLVNPKVSLPYWDYTIEDYKIQTEFDGLYSRLEEASPMFGPNWFGSADKDDHMVKDGRWAWTKVLTVSDVEEADGITANVYGQLRSPWSANSNPFIVRGMGNSCGDFIYPSHLWPSCQYHYDLLQFGSYYDYAYNSLGKSHGPIHFWIGGVNDCDKTFADMAELIGPKNTAVFSDDADANRKNMWREGFWTCTGTAPLGTPMDEVMETYCGCEQAGWDYDNDDHIDTIISRVVGSSVGKSFDIEIQRKLVKLLCNGKINMGEQLLSSSPQDPTFWPVHPTIERLTVLKLFSNTMDMTTWISQGYTKRSADGTSTKYKVSVYGDECVGHRPYDVWPYGIVSDTEFSTKLYMFGEKKVNQLTNFEATLALNPRTDALPYVYDRFEWPHCDAQGINMLDIAKAALMEAQA